MVGRLYLDTADLIEIADQKVDAALVSELHEAMAKHRTCLVIARAHFWDGLAAVDAATAERFISTVECFGMILMVVDGPDVCEPLSETRRCARRPIVIAGIGAT